MNILLTSAGRRTKLIEYFLAEFKGLGKVIVTDCDPLAPALYIADKGYIVPRIDDESYLDALKKIIKKEGIGAVLSLIDPELSLLSQWKSELEKLDVKVIVSDKEAVLTCFDKFRMFEFLKKCGLKCAETYIDIESFKADYRLNKIKFPVFVKPRKGSASIDAKVIDNIEELSLVMKRNQDMLIQEFLDGKELGVDVYVDLISKKVTSVFIKEKLRMRSGETDKALSIADNELFNIIEDLVTNLKLVGPIDIDVFKIRDEYYISEINPRFGGGYLLAYECGANFPFYIKNNLIGLENSENIGNYRENIYMMKHDVVTVKSNSELNTNCILE
ncbi:ATP-grasp domain-containing protein [Clostridium sp. D2Q-11]|uniref:ATP-grasp domain-containing protein n=2 Tax=Anaeromonas frigoriresistens TaxID=2683708 RepID=A0A942Z905_9FIRM|nr:ATP-grasp domain-containing protein [Anaeromonas frigoriresistens]MBS4538823.1 ATP-grasp domain-containing protein [Anaeromonas frigoriresistens]